LRIQFRILSPSELPPGIDSGTEFTSVCINTALYLPYLVGQCRKHGVVLKRSILTHIGKTTSLHHSGRPADLLINCTGLLASLLGGVEDKSVIPARGQTVLVRNDGLLNYGSSGTEDGPEESTYTMTRASGGGTILGGCYQLGNWNGMPDLDLAARIMKRAVELNPNLAEGKGVEGLSIVRHAVGLRPYRAEGVRLDKEKIGGTWVVHCYGHGGFGYQVSWACSGDVVKLVESIEWGSGKEKAML
jgi:D-amino-acid oxidase